MLRVALGGVLLAIGAFLISEATGTYGDDILLVPGIFLAVMGAAVLFRWAVRETRAGQDDQT